MSNVGVGDSRDNHERQDKLVIAAEQIVSIRLNLDNRPEPASKRSEVIIPRSLPAQIKEPPLPSHVNART